MKVDFVIQSHVPFGQTVWHATYPGINTQTITTDVQQKPIHICFPIEVGGIGNYKTTTLAMRLGLLKAEQSAYRLVNPKFL